MTFWGFLVLMLYALVLVNEAIKNSGHGSSGNNHQLKDDDVLKKRENLSADDFYGASTYDDPWEYYVENAGRFEDFNEANYYYHLGHMEHDNERNE